MDRHRVSPENAQFVSIVSRLFGLGTAVVTPWRIDSACVGQDAAVRVGLSDGARRANIALRLVSREKGFLQGGAPELFYEGKQAADDDLLQFLQGVSLRLRSVRPEQLARLMRDLPRCRSHDDSDGSKAEERCVSDRLGGNPGQWRRFFCNKEFSRQLHWTSAPGRRAGKRSVVHPAKDCPLMPGDMTFPGMSFFNYPPAHSYARQSPVRLVLSSISSQRVRHSLRVAGFSMNNELRGELSRIFEPLGWHVRICSGPRASDRKGSTAPAALSAPYGLQGCRDFFEGCR